MQIDNLAEALEQFVNTDDWDEARRTVEQNPSLLSDQAQQLLSENISDYRRMDRDDVADYLEEHRLLLERSREVGVERAFQEADARAHEVMEARKSQLSELRPENPDRLQSAVWQLLDAGSPEALDRAMAEHPELAQSEQALTYIDDLIQEAKNAGYNEALRFLREYHELVRTLAELPPLMRTLQEFMVVPTWGESRDILKQHPELMGDEAVQTMDSLIREAEAQGDEPTANVLRTYRQVLQRAREVGPDQAVDETMQVEQPT